MARRSRAAIPGKLHDKWFGAKCSAWPPDVKVPSILIRHADIRFPPRFYLARFDGHVDREELIALQQVINEALGVSKDA